MFFKLFKNVTDWKMCENVYGIETLHQRWWVEEKSENRPLMANILQDLATTKSTMIRWGINDSLIR